MLCQNAKMARMQNTGLTIARPRILCSFCRCTYQRLEPILPPHRPWDATKERESAAATAEAGASPPRARRRSSSEYRYRVRYFHEDVGRYRNANPYHTPLPVLDTIPIPNLITPIRLTSPSLSAKQTDATSASPSSMRSVPSAAPRRPMRTATGAAPGEEETPTPSAPP